MARRTFFLTNGVDANGWDALSETGQVAATTATEWVVGTGSTNHSEMASNAARAANTFTGTTVPDGTLDTTLKDALRSPDALTETYAPGNWEFHFVVRAATNGGAQDGRMRFRVIKADADGANATEITSAQELASEVLNVSTSADFDSTLTVQLPRFSLTSQYLFFQLAWERTGAGGMTNSDILLRTGVSATEGTRIITADIESPAGSNGEFQIPGGPFVDETTSDEYQIPGAQYINETQAAAGNTANPGFGSIIFAGKAPDITRFVIPGRGIVVFTGFAPTVTVVSGQTANPGNGAIVFTGFAPTADIDVFKAPDKGTIAFTGKAPDITRFVVPGKGAIVFNGFAPTATTGQVAAPDKGAIVFTGLAPSVTRTQHVFKTPDSGLITFSGFAPGVAGGEAAVVAAAIVPSGVRKRKRRLRVLPDGRIALADDLELQELLKFYRKDQIRDVPKARERKIKVKPIPAPEIIAQMQEEADVMYVMKEIARLIH